MPEKYTHIKIYPELNNAYFVTLYGDLDDTTIQTWIQKHTKQTVAWERITESDLQNIIN